MRRGPLLQSGECTKLSALFRISWVVASGDRRPMTLTPTASTLEVNPFPTSRPSLPLTSTIIATHSVLIQPKSSQLHFHGVHNTIYINCTRLPASSLLNAPFQWVTTVLRWEGLAAVHFPSCTPWLYRMELKWVVAARW